MLNALISLFQSKTVRCGDPACSPHRIPREEAYWQDHTPFCAPQGFMHESALGDKRRDA